MALVSDNNLSVGKVGTIRQPDVDSKIAEATIAFGKGLMKGTDAESQVLEFDGTDSKFDGFALYSIYASDLDNENYEENDPVSVLREGECYVKVDSGSSGINAGDRVAIMPSGDIDAVTNLSSGSSGDYAIELPNSEIKEDGAAGDVVMIEINSPQDATTTELAA